MIEKVRSRNGEKVIEVRSQGGKLLLIKTKDGYEIKCPRTKTICLIKYEEMISDCLSCRSDDKDYSELLQKLTMKTPISNIEKGKSQ